MSSLELRLLVKVVDATQAVPANGDQPAQVPPTSVPVNNIFHSLFKQCQVSLNNVQVTQDDSNYAYKGYFQNTLNFGYDSVISSLRCQGYYPDDLNMNSVVPGENQGARNRQTLFGVYGGYKNVELVGKLHSDIFQIDKYLPNGIDIRITLIKEKPSFYIMGGYGDVKILEASIAIDHKVINPSILTAHHYVLESKNMIIPFKRSSVKQYTISAGLTSISIDNFILGRIPNNLIFAMVSHRAYTGDRALNPFNFTHNNIQSFSLYVNGEQIPSKPLYFDYTVANAPVSTRGYNTLFKGLGINQTDFGHQITKSRFDNGYFMLAFDLTADQNVNDTCANMIQEGAMRIEFKLSQPLAEPITCLIYTECDSSLEIDRSKNIFVIQ